ncbi:armadillo repeat containing protein 3 [Echinococcus multilocularis]|uniref:Armadillo repeat containing protein 3 n=1 Tax=Echinococcus multilocularis TaxID=6211 RepID=A0A068YEN0_ECHMU|nr:armadillo repeat containing protein 3 [Echinococcus multilocularis]
MENICGDNAELQVGAIVSNVSTTVLWISRFVFVHHESRDVDTCLLSKTPLKHGVKGVPRAKHRENSALVWREEVGWPSIQIPSCRILQKIAQSDKYLALLLENGVDQKSTNIDVHGAAAKALLYLLRDEVVRMVETSSAGHEYPAPQYSVVHRRNATYNGFALPQRPNQWVLEELYMAQSLQDQSSTLAGIAIKSILDANPILKFAMTASLDFLNITGNLFYDVGLLKASGRLKSLQFYAKYAVNDARPVWILNITEIGSANFCGDPMTWEDAYSSIDWQEVSQYRCHYNTNTVRISLPTRTGYRHRALLFKIIAGKVEIPCRYVCGENQTEYSLICIQASKRTIEAVHNGYSDSERKT